MVYSHNILNDKVNKKNMLHMQISRTPYRSIKIIIYIYLMYYHHKDLTTQESPTCLILTGSSWYFRAKTFVLNLHSSRFD